MRSLRAIAILVVVGLMSSSAMADDWAQWNGPTRDGRFPFSAKIKFAEDPKPVWEQEIGLGYSGPVVAGERVVVTDYVQESGSITNNAGKRDELFGDERISCLDRRSGEILWQYDYDCNYKISYPSGPRATPVIHAGKVIALGSEGDLLCLDLSTGEVLWQVSFREQFGAQTPLWGHAASPLVYVDQVICMVGGQGSLVVAFDLATGKVKWKSLTQEKNETGYCPPSIVEHGGKTQLMTWSPTTVSSLNPDTGSVYWQAPL
ncbi:MAG: PQQ-binding-like beta-propeller repeat protein, partial [Planctomycetota bacterium]